MSEPTRFPLHWPVGFSRATQRTWAKFSTKAEKAGGPKTTRRITVAEAVDRVIGELRAFSRTGRPWRTADDPRRGGCVISTNVPLTRHGMHISGRSEPADPGVAVYFELDGRPLVLCCDKWDRVADNLAAVAATLGAMRGLERWGVTEVSRAFDGFQALPAPGESTTAESCWAVLGLAPSTSYTAADIEQAFRSRAKTCHPDSPAGSHEAFTALQSARGTALLQTLP